jgi:hypothetical protein
LYEYVDDGPTNLVDRYGFAASGTNCGCQPEAPLGTSDRFWLVVSGSFDLYSAQEKLFAAAAYGTVAEATGELTMPEAIYDALTAAPTGVSGLGQVAAGLTGNNQLAKGAQALDPYTGYAPLITYGLTCNEEDAAAVASIQALWSGGFEGATSPMGFKRIGELVVNAHEVVSWHPTGHFKWPPKCDDCK